MNLGITKNGITIEVPQATLVSLIMEKLGDKPLPTPGQLPAIGTHWEGQGGIFAGIMRGREGGKDYALILGTMLPEGEFDETQERAADLEVDGHRDFRCPYRNEQSLLYANLKDRFESKWYWSCERHEADERSAWAQNFDDGGQDDWGVNDDSLGCPVRVIPL